MWQRIRAVARDLSGRRDRDLIHHLAGQLEATIEGVGLTRRVVSGELAPAAARERMGTIEHAGDEHRRELILELAGALAPPMDRGDLFRLSRSVDDVLDNLRDLVRELDLYEIGAEPLLIEPLTGVEDGVGALRAAVVAIAEEPDRASIHAIEARKSDVRPRYQRAMAQLLVGDGPVTLATLRRREALRRVDVIGLRLGEAADALADGAVKRSR